MDVIGEIRLWTVSYAPDNWIFCDGRSLSISDYPFLFQLIGTTYGGDGFTTFNVPDLQSRVPIGAGQGPGLPNYTLGQTGGKEKNTLIVDNLPTHTHTYNGTGILVSGEDGHKTTIAGNYQAVNGQFMYSDTADSQMAGMLTTLTVSNTGVAAPIPNLMPYLVISYIICYDGEYPHP
ncbi:MAG: phage tail protein [Niastella sp.]|jgi:microcystin-dependent protein|uniref:phage tail protein n=1 Tax=Niastella sp. TaxID=1869183 RepID=UPI003899B38C